MLMKSNVHGLKVGFTLYFFVLHLLLLLVSDAVQSWLQSTLLTVILCEMHAMCCVFCVFLACLMMSMLRHGTG